MAVGAELPRFIKDAFDAFPERGILSHGFLSLCCGWRARLNAFLGFQGAVGRGRPRFRVGIRASEFRVLWPSPRFG